MIYLLTQHYSLKGYDLQSKKDIFTDNIRTQSDRESVRSVLVAHIFYHTVNHMRHSEPDVNVCHASFHLCMKSTMNRLTEGTHAPA